MPKKKYHLPKSLQNKPLGSENWYQIFYRKDRQPTTKWVRLQAHDLSGAKVERERLLRSYELGLFDPWDAKPKKAPRKDPRLIEAAAAYLKTQSGLALNTRKGKRACLNTFIQYVGRGRLRIRQITEEDVEGFVERPGIEEGTRHKRLGQLCTFFAWCIEERYCETNPALEYKRRRDRGLSAYTKRKRSGSAREALMPGDVEKLLASVRANKRQLFLYDIFLFALATGLRRNELAHLNERDLYLAAAPRGLDYPVVGYVRVRCWTNSKTGEEFITKNGKDRIVPLCPLAARIAHRQLLPRDSEAPWRPLFRAPKGGRLAGTRLSEWFQKHRTEAGLTDQMTFHSLRHSFASWLMMLGVNLFSIRQILGHSSLEQLETYAELCEEYLLGDARALQRQMFFVFCPDLPDVVVDRVLPRRRSLLAALSDEKFGRVQTLRSIIPMEDVLFSGIAYEDAGTSEGVLYPEQEEQRFSFLETF